MAKQPDPHLLRCLAIQQPWAWAACAGVKTVENRTQATPYRGQIAILASQTKTNVNQLARDSGGSLTPGFFNFGAIIGVATLADVVEMSPDLEDNPDAVGPVCWVLKDARLLPQPIPSNGKLNLYSLTGAESDAVRRQLLELQPQPLTDAGRAWAAAYRSDPVDLLTGRARSYLDLGRPADAVRNYDAALRIRPEEVNLVVLRGIALGQAGRLDDALADLDRAVREQPENAVLLACRGEVFHDSERFDDAIRDFDAALKLDPDNHDFLLGRVHAYLGKKAADPAIRDCTKLIESNPEHALAFMLRREAHLLRGDSEKAEADRRAAAAIDPEGVAGWDEQDDEEGA